MEPARVYAYRSVLYWAMLDLRWNALRRRTVWWNFVARGRAVRRLAYCVALADWLHNLAEFSRRDFDGFREEWFWREFDNLAQTYKGAMRYDFRQKFESELAGYDPDNR